MAPSYGTSVLLVWRGIWCWSRPNLQAWRRPHAEAQWPAGHTCWFFREVSSEVALEPWLQPWNRETTTLSQQRRWSKTRQTSALTAFGDSETSRNDAFFDVRVFHPGAPSYQNQSLSSLYRQHECKKRLAYGRRGPRRRARHFHAPRFYKWWIEGGETTTAMKRLAHLVSDKRAEPYSIVMGWLRCKATFSLLRSALPCLRGSMIRTRNIDFTSISEATAIGKIAYWENVCVDIWWLHF